MDYVESRLVDDFEIYQLESIPPGAVSHPGRTALWFDLEAGGESASLRGANRLLELADGTVIAVVKDETAVFRSNGLPAFALTAGTWSVKHRVGRGQRVTETTLPSPSLGEFKPNKKGNCWNAVALQEPPWVAETGQARLAQPKYDFAADFAVTRSRTDFGKGKE